MKIKPMRILTMGEVLLSAADWELCQRAIAAYKEPEWKPFPGEIVEVSDDNVQWDVRTFKRSQVGWFWCTWAGAAGKEIRWGMCRPLSNPLVVQFRPHDGEAIPEESRGKQVYVKCRSGLLATYTNADHLTWTHTGALSDIIGWCLVREQQGAGESDG